MLELRVFLKFDKEVGRDRMVQGEVLPCVKEALSKSESNSRI